jgi:chromosome segregation ATPase
MSLDRQINELEKHLDYASSYMADVKSELEELEGKFMNEIADYIDRIDTLNEQNELLEEQVEDLNRKLAIFELENIELRLRIEVYDLEV